MDEAIKWVVLLGPIITVVVALIGLRAWYWQLVAKRRFEVAEQAITVFERAVDGLRAIRNPGSFKSENDAVEVNPGASEEEKQVVQRYGIYFRRAQPYEKAFEEVRLVQLLAGLHISKKAGDAVAAPLTIRQKTLAAAHMLIVDSQERFPGLPQTQLAEMHERRRKYEYDLWEMRREDGTPFPHDRLSKMIDEARETLERECIPLLREQTFFEFLWGGPRPVIAAPAKNV